MIRIKTEKEIDGIRKSCHELAKLHDTLESFVEVGMSTKDIDDFIKDYLKKRNLKSAFYNYAGFPGQACISVNNEIIHGIPSKSKIIGKGDLVKIDAGINLNSYISDSARTLVMEGASKEHINLSKVTKQSLYRAIQVLEKPNVRVRDISLAVFNHVKRHNYGVVKDYCGHGVGLELHEDPQIPNYPFDGLNPRIKEGMVIAIEPMITLKNGACRTLDNDWTVVTIDNSYASHWEHTIAITKNGPEILTESFL